MLLLLSLALLGGLVWYMTDAVERAHAWRLAASAVQTGLSTVRSRRRPPSPLDALLHARTKHLVLTPVLAAAPALVFVGLLASAGGPGDTTSLLEWGASLGTRTTNGEWWRLLTAGFVHAGLLELVVNLAAVVTLGRVLERLVGPAACAATFIGCSMLGQVAALAEAPATVTAGAAAGICGLYGLLIATWMWGVAQRSATTIRVRTVARLAPAAAAFFVYHAWGAWVVGVPEQLATGAGFLTGLALSRRTAEATTPWRPVLATLAVTCCLTAAATVPLRGISDVGAEIERLLALEERHTMIYDQVIVAVNRARTSRREAVELIERTILPQVVETRRRMKSLDRVPRQQLEWIDSADEYLRLREDSWRLRALGNTRSSLAVLRQADEQERLARQALRRLSAQAGVITSE